MTSVGGAAPTLTRQYTYGGDLISQRQLIGGNWVTSFYQYDGHGSVRGLTDVNGTLTDQYDYDAFGILINQVGTTPNLYLYAGEQWDADLQMYFNRARYLNVGTGRFWTQDSYEGSDYDPESLHKYTYAANNPANLIDPSGKSYIDVLTVITIVSVLINAAQASFHLYNAYHATDPIIKAVETNAALINTAGILLSLIPGGGIPGAGSKAFAGGYSIAQPFVIASYKVILGSIIIPAGVTLGTLIFSTPAGGGGSGSSSGSSGSGGSGPNVRIGQRSHVDVPKHNLDRLGSTWADQERLIIEAVRRMYSNAPSGAPTAGGTFIEGTTQVQSVTGNQVTLTVRWYENSATGEIVVGTAFCP